MQTAQHLLKYEINLYIMLAGIGGVAATGGNPFGLLRFVFQDDSFKMSPIPWIVKLTEGMRES